MIHAIIFITSLLLTPAPGQADAMTEDQKSGYEWARDNGIEDPQSCATESSEFNEGCLSFITEAAAPVTDTQAEETDIPTDNMPAGYDFPDDQFTILE